MKLATMLIVFFAALDAYAAPAAVGSVSLGTLSIIKEN